jgi:mono/diheme cytochrome c family protein
VRPSPIIVLAALLLLSAGSRALAADPPLGAPDDGRFSKGSPGQVLYMRQGCFQCHGMAGQGSIASGPGLLPLRLDDAAFRRYVRSPTGAMPPFTDKVLSDQDLGAIEAYVRALAQPKPYTSIPLLARTAP